MTFWEHLTELRKRLFRMILAWFVMTVIAFIYSRFIFDKILLAPKEPDFITYKWLCQLGKLIHADSLCLPPMSLSIINLNLSGQFMTDMTVSMFAGLIIGSPFIIYQLWQFIMPALYDKERRYARRAVFIMSFLFILGVLFSYYLMVPWTLNFLGTYQVSSMGRGAAGRSGSQAAAQVGRRKSRRSGDAPTPASPANRRSRPWARPRCPRAAGASGRSRSASPGRTARNWWCGRRHRGRSGRRPRRP